MKIIEYIERNPDLLCYVSQSRKMLWMRIPKVASTSMTLTFEERFNDFECVNTNIDRFRDEPLGRYFKFAFVRNPYDRIVSIWNHFRVLIPGRKIPDCTFQEFLEKNYYQYNQAIKEHTRSQCDYVMKDGHMFMDFIGKFETIQNDWAYVANRFGLKGVVLPVMNNHKHKPYLTFYRDEWCRKQVTKMYFESINLFGYSL